MLLVARIRRGERLLVRGRMHDVDDDECGRSAGAMVQCLLAAALVALRSEKRESKVSDFILRNN